MDDSYKRIPHCVQCFRVVEVELAHDIYLQDEGMRDGEYFAIYGKGPPQPFCRACRHRLTAFERLIGIWQRDGCNVRWLKELPIPG